MEENLEMNDEQLDLHIEHAAMPDVRLLRSLTLRNILSFGPETPPLELRALNVLIGPNGSGKSNLLDCVGLLQSAPDKLANTVRTEGSIQAWLWNGSKYPTAHVEAVVAPLEKYRPALRHWFEFRQSASRFELTEERIEGAETVKKISSDKPFLYFGNEGGRTMLNVNMTDLAEPAKGRGKPKAISQRILRKEEIDPELSILSQRKDIHFYPELTYLGEMYGQTRLYREWPFGRSNPARRPQPADTPGNFLREGGENLALVLNQLRRDAEAKDQIVKALNELYDGIEDYETFVQGGYVELFLREGKQLIPASRLSDGTLRYLCLLAILLHPTPPPLICLEEPELGLHPDAVLAVGKLIRDASERTQLIITTHSDILIDVLGEQPENIIVCEKQNGQTTMQRLNSEELKDWLKRYSLGELWTRGHLGGNRW
jgi:predicted ATPase